MNKKYMHSVIIVAILLILISLYYFKPEKNGYVYTSSLAAPKVTLSTTAVDYTNKVYGFQFQQPAGTMLVEDSQTPQIVRVQGPEPENATVTTFTFTRIDTFLPAGQEPTYYKKGTKQMVTYDSVDKGKVTLTQDSDIQKNNWFGFTVLGTVYIPNEKTGYILGIENGGEILNSVKLIQ